MALYKHINDISCPEERTRQNRHARQMAEGERDTQIRSDLPKAIPKVNGRALEENPELPSSSPASQP